MAEELWAYDLETAAIVPGLLAPRVVCGSWSNGTETHLALREEALDWLEVHLGAVRIVGANIFYDLVCAAAERPQLLPLIFEAVEDGRLLDVLLLEALHDNARGCLYKGPTGAPIGRYSLAFLEARYLGEDRSDQKTGADAWRLRYGELDGVPLEDWPEEAKAYPRADAYGTWRVAQAQLAEHPPESPEYRQNVHCIGREMRAGLTLALACTWGMRTDKPLVDRVVEQVKKEHEESRRLFFKSGIVRVRPCTKKKNKETGVSEYERADDIPKGWLRESLGSLPVAEWATSRAEDLRKAIATLDKGRGIRWAEDKGTLAALVSEAYAGSPPLTDSGGVSTARDTLAESGSELLEAYAEAGENEKLLSTYVDVLEQGTKVPINPRTTTILETGRVSYSKPNLTQLPRGSDDQNASLWAKEES